MEQYNFSKMLIKDSEFYNPRCTYVGMFKRNNITTINQLLDDEAINKIMEKCHPKTRKQLVGFVSMLKYKYLGVPLYNDILLNKELQLETNSSITLSNSDLLILKVGDKNECIAISQLLGCSHETGNAILKKFYSTINNPLLYEYNFTNNNIILIDFLKWMLKNEQFKQTHPFIYIYIEVFENNQKINNKDNDPKIINILKEQLTNLIKTKENLDIQISNLQQKINKLSNINTKGDIRK